MGYRTVSLTHPTERRTYINGNFKGKYHGTLNQSKSSTNVGFYDIYIYEGHIWNIKNHIEHPSDINETHYNAIESETNLAQNSFNNVISYPNDLIGPFDGFKLQINHPKLEDVHITDVIKDGNKTFGTLTCIVSGYLSEPLEQNDKIKVETCDTCGNFLEECICSVEDIKQELSNTDTQEYDVELQEKIGRNPWFAPIKSILFKKGIFDLGNPKAIGLGCLVAVAIIAGGFFLFSMDLAGILISVILGLIFIFGSGTTIFRSTFRKLSWILYPSLGITLFGLLLFGIDKCRNPSDHIKPQNIPTSSSSMKIEKEGDSTIPVKEVIEKKAETTNARPKLKKVQIIDSPIEWYTGDFYICTGKYSKRYHYNINCPGLSNCSTKIQNINRPEAKRQGRTLCELEHEAP